MRVAAGVVQPTQRGEPEARPAAIARALGLAASLAGLACAAAQAPPDAASEVALRRAWSNADTGLELYESGEYVLAAQRFDTAAGLAQLGGDRELQRSALIAQCMAWLQARQLEPLCTCGDQLAQLRRSGRRPDPGTNTLIAFAAIAGGRPLPLFAIPPSVRPLVRAAAQEPR